MNDAKNTKEQGQSVVDFERLVRRFIPSNGTDGMIFTENFCEQCVHEKFMHTQNHDDKQCEIFNNSILNDRPCYNKDLKFDGWEWFSFAGKPKCNQWQKWDWDKNDDGDNDPPKEPTYDPNQLLLFSFDGKLDELIKEKNKEYAT